MAKSPQKTTTVTANVPISHDGGDYGVGDPFDVIDGGPDDELQQLLSVGAVTVMPAADPAPAKK